MRGDGTVWCACEEARIADCDCRGCPDRAAPPPADQNPIKRRLSPRQLAYLRALAEHGPAVAPASSHDTPTWLYDLDRAGLIEHHPPCRYRITEAGHAALERVAPTPVLASR